MSSQKRRTTLGAAWRAGAANEDAMKAAAAERDRSVLMERAEGFVIVSKGFCLCVTAGISFQDENAACDWIRYLTLW